MNDMHYDFAMFSDGGQRKYLTSSELDAFLEAAEKRPLQIRAFCLMLYHSGCRISEALALTAEQIDFDQKVVVVQSLKKRKKTHFRSIPIPDNYLEILKILVSDIPAPNDRLWPWARMTAYRYVRSVMLAAGVVGEQASPKGLRHGFAIRAIQQKVPLPLVQRWLGHADLKTTAIYTHAVGPEEREIAARMWPGPQTTIHRSKVTHPESRNMLLNSNENNFQKGAEWVGCSCPTSVSEPVPPCPVVQERTCRELRGDLQQTSENNKEEIRQLAKEVSAATQGTSTVSKIFNCQRLHNWLKCIAVISLKSLILSTQYA
ncbi:MAG: tyrosine-type recombinase/integrase [Tsuneonella suprasediminis]|nr:tyrosine-type recombinase/integrase [Tsuneonella suprasediminis]UBS34352.1 site-specific integrase [Altererythrobacter sp. N1]